MSESRRRIGGVRDWPLQVKISIGFGVVMLMLVLNTFGFYYAQERQKSARALTANTDEVIEGLQNLEIAALDQQGAIRGLIVSGDTAFLKPYEAARGQFAKQLSEVVELTRENVQVQGALNATGDAMSSWQQRVAEPARRMAADAAQAASARVLINTGRLNFDAVRAGLASARAAELKLLQDRRGALDVSATWVRNLMLGFLVAGLLMTLFAIRLTERLVTRPVVRMTALMTRLAGHDHDIEVPGLSRGDELGAIARALQSFKLMAIETYTQGWIKGSISELSRKFQQATSVSEYTSALTDGAAGLLGCGFVVFYGLDEHDALNALGGYGFSADELPRLHFAIGEGLVGQCARQREAIAVDEVPDGYARIRSGVGAAPPRKLLFLPVLAKDRVLGVLELAAFHEFTTAQRNFLDALMPVMALSYQNLQSALKTRQLLEEMKSQSEALRASEETLRAQQSELRAINESLQAKTGLLEQQAAQLKASEEELKLQAEELRVSNDQLTEKSVTLEDQKLILEKLNTETREKAVALERASQYKSDFLANMSHELRTPLNSLLILSRSLADNEDGHLDADEVESAEVIHGSGAKLLQLINDILDISKVEAGKMELLYGEVTLTDFVSVMRRNFRHVAAGRQLDFETGIEPGLPAAITSDAARLEQIANNLLGNAFKFTKAGGVRMMIARPAEDTVLPDGLSRDAAIAISVTDTGIGIPAEKMSRMFQAFEQVDAGTSRHYGGTGLGLSIARGMARLLGGDITMSSEFGVGSCFTLLLPEHPPLLLPIAAASAGGSGHAAPKAMPVPARTLAAVDLPVPSIVDDRELLQAGDTTILIVEDDPEFARILAELIRRKGYRVLAAGDGETGLALARQYRPSGVLLDVMLPGMDGWAVMDRIKADPGLRQIPVHFISATDDRERGLEAGAIGFLTKPISKSSLLEAFDRLLQHVPDDTRRVLLVDDDRVSRHAMRRLLDERGIELTDAATAEAALLLVAETRFDCIVLDLGLPGMSGYEFLERASALGPLPPIVIHSGHELSREESLKLRQYTDSIVIKGARSPERLLDEVSLFLHSIRPVAAPPLRELDVALGGRTVLIVDDDMRNIFALSKALRAKGLKVLMAQDGHKALRQLKDNDDIEIVLMDIMMPGMDGYDTMREVRNQPEYRELPIIAVTAKAMRGDREKCLEAGANDYLSKPVDVDKLLSMMRVWVRPRV